MQNRTRWLRCSMSGIGEDADELTRVSSGRCYHISGNATKLQSMIQTMPPKEKIL